MTLVLAMVHAVSRWVRELAARAATIHQPRDAANASDGARRSRPVSARAVGDLGGRSLLVARVRRALMVARVTGWAGCARRRVPPATAYRYRWVGGANRLGLSRVVDGLPPTRRLRRAGVIAIDETRTQAGAIAGQTRTYAS